MIRTLGMKSSEARSDAVNVAHVIDSCNVLGPGSRFAIWVQGCPLRCAGCINPELLPFRDATWMPVEELARKILDTSGIEGVTYGGGEPFVQAGALARLSGLVRAHGLSVMVYSGFTLRGLRRGCLPDTEALLAETDLLMDGPYRQELPTFRPWRGSDNQRLWALSDRYRQEVPTWNQPLAQQFEIHLSPNGGIDIVGIPPAEKTVYA